MAKEVKATTVTVGPFMYQGEQVVVQEVVSNYEREEKLDSLVKMVKVLKDTDGELEQPE